MKFAAGMSAIGVFIAAGLVAGAEAQPWRDGRDGGDRRGGQPQWLELGCFAVGVVPERGILPVGRDEGQFRALRLTAGGKDIEVQDITVVYGNGRPEIIPFRAIVKEGQPSAPVDLRGRDRTIERIELIARKRDRGFSFSKAKLCLAGLEDDSRPRPPEVARWQELGCVDFGRRLEIGTVPVGRREGRYKAIRLEVGGDPMRIEDLTVVYGNGAPDEIVVETDIRAGAISNPLDLKGRDRAIDRIEVSGRKLQRQWTPGRATLCISGLEDVRRPEPPKARLDNLGCVEVRRRPNSAGITVGRKDGFIRSLSFEARNADVTIDQLRVVYSNGRFEEPRVTEIIQEGVTSKPIELRDAGSPIESVFVTARKEEGQRGVPGELCVQGLVILGPPPRPSRF